MSAIADAIAETIAPDGDKDPFDYIYHWVISGVVSPKEAISFLIETGYNHGIAYKAPLADT